MSLMTCATCADHAFTVDFCASAVTDRPSFRVPKLQSLHSIVQQRCNMCGAAQGLGAGLAPAWRRLGVVPRVVPGAGGCARGRAARQRAAATETQSNKRPWRPRIELLIRIARQHRSAPGFFFIFSRSAGRFAPGVLPGARPVPGVPPGVPGVLPCVFAGRSVPGVPFWGWK